MRSWLSGALTLKPKPYKPYNEVIAVGCLNPCRPSLKSLAKVHFCEDNPDGKEEHATISEALP